jgi:hypothetical protein
MGAVRRTTAGRSMTIAKEAQYCRRKDAVGTKSGRKPDEEMGAVRRMTAGRSMTIAKEVHCRW